MKCLVLALTFTAVGSLAQSAPRPAPMPSASVPGQQLHSATAAYDEPTSTDAAKLAAASGRTIARLSQLKAIYIQPMASDLDSYIKAEMSKKLSNGITVVLKPEDADGVLTGIGEWRKGFGAVIVRWLGLHDTATGAVTLVSGDKVLWASEAGDRSFGWGPMKRGGQRKVADRLVENLKTALENDQQAKAD